MEVKYQNESIKLHSLHSIQEVAAILSAPNIESIEVIYTLNEIHQLRAKAYKVESDSLYMAWQFDQTPEAEQAWRTKVEEIKARYPKPTA